MSSNMNVNPQSPGLDPFFNLQAPNEQGSGYNNLVVNVNGVPLGENAAAQSIAIQLGYSDKDTIGSAIDEVLALAAKLNISLTISGDEDSVQIYINTLDPSQPNVPPIRALINISDKDIAAGKIGGFSISIQTEENTATGQTQKQAKISASTGRNKGADGEDDDSAGGGVGAEDDSSGTTGKSGAKVDETEGGGVGTKEDDSGGSSIGLQNIEDTVNDGLEKAGDLGKKTNDAVEAGRANNTLPLTKTEVTIGKTVGGNPWLGGNVYVGFLETFMEMQRILMQNKVVQGNVELAGMNLTVTLAQTTAEVIMAIAHVNQMIHIVTAVMSGVSIAISLGGLYMTAKGAHSAAAAAKDPTLVAKHAGWVEMGGVIGQMGPQLEKMTTAAVQAATDLMIAEKEGLKEILQAYRTLAQHQMDKGAETFKASEDLINQAIQSLDKIRDNLQQAIAASLRK